MHYIVRLFPEITIKSSPVRKRLTRQVKDNLRKLLLRLDRRIEISRDWEKIDIWVEDDSANLRQRIEEVLVSTPGVAKFSRVRSYPLTAMEDMLPPVIELWPGSWPSMS